ncbi:heme ABC transporter permease [Pedomonas mirosovicensis]|uniref:heme ABC transporter permease n=1 Tax=Pedomonas mirosovicensis TaxID=2908641 RepID=UPI0021698DAF|nr:heme ABC transporter permease [Pedomonas mirosovicensis]MCH8683784.1 heme ABC transporter permease [Pedomonas mirosovicensis]
MHRFANPARFLRIARAVQPWTAAATLIAFAFGLYYALVASPIDYLQRDTVRIMYVHVPAAWLALGAYATIAVASLVSIVWRHPLADVCARAAAPIGATFTAICLITGSFWGKPTWGTWWQWDARMTSVLVLLFVYLGYMALWSAFDDRQRAARAAAILALVGAINLPIIKFSVDWWNTLHQPASVFRSGGSTIHPAMLTPLLIMALAYLLFFVTTLLMRMRAELAAQRLEVAAERRALALEGAE